MSAEKVNTADGKHGNILWTYNMQWVIIEHGWGKQTCRMRTTVYNGSVLGQGHRRWPNTEPALCWYKAITYSVWYK